MSSRLALVAPVVALAFLVGLLAAFALSSDKLGGAADQDGPVAGDAMTVAAAANAQAIQPAATWQVQPAGVGVTAGPLHVHPTNPRYFADTNGNVVYLTGSHFWFNLQDGGLTDPPPVFDYSEFLDFLVAHNHNFFRLWRWEQTWYVPEWPDPYYFAPHPYQRTGPENALDGKPKFDLTKFNQAYFDRMRQRILEAKEQGIYVSIMLFDGWSVAYPKAWLTAGNVWLGHPFNVNNNINGINGDPNGDNGGSETHTLAVAAVTALQEAYVKKVIDTVNDLDNVLYEISNESDGGSEAWQYHMIEVIRNYEATKPYQHAVGMTAEWPDGSNQFLLDSDADWISPAGDINNPTIATGAKVIIADTDHLCGICGSRSWVWKSFTRGENPIFMDQYDGSYQLEGHPYDTNNANDVSLRRNLGYTRSYANRINLAAMVPRPDLASTGYALANAAAQNAEYLVYMPEGSMFNVDLSATPGTLNVEWFNPATGTATQDGTIQGGQSRQFAPPFSGDAVLYLYQTVAKPTYQLVLASIGSGSVSAQPTGPYLSGQVITVTATADPGWDFAGWSGGISGSQNPASFAITADTTVTAIFTADAEPTYQLFVPTVGNGTVEVEPSGPYTSGQVIELTAVAAPGWSFANWSGGAAGSDNPRQVTILADMTVTATFAPSSTTFTLTLTRVGNGDVAVDPLLAGYPVGAAITLTAIPTDEWAFVGWSGDVSGVENPKHLTITADTSITATFGALHPNACQLIVRTVGNGSVDAVPPGPYVSDQQVALTAMPAAGWQFVEWSGGVIGSANPVSLTVTADTTVTATFTALEKHYLFLGGISRSSDAAQGAAAPE